MTKLPKLFSYSVATVVSFFMWLYVIDGIKAGIKLYQSQSYSQNS